MTEKSTDRLEGTPETKEISATPEKPGARFRWGQVALGLLVAAIAFLVYQNIGNVPVRAFWWEFSLPLVVVIVATSIVTLVIQVLVGLVVRWRRHRWRYDFKRAVRNRWRRRR